MNLANAAYLFAMDTAVNVSPSTNNDFSMSKEQKASAVMGKCKSMMWPAPPQRPS